MIALDFTPKKYAKLEVPLSDKNLDFSIMWQDRFSDTDDIELQKKEVDELLKEWRKPRYFE